MEIISTDRCAINCGSHQGEEVAFCNMALKKLLCRKCLIKQDIYRVQGPFPIQSSQLLETKDLILKALFDKLFHIQHVIQQFQQLQSDGNHFMDVVYSQGYNLVQDDLSRLQIRTIFDPEPIYQLPQQLPLQIQQVLIESQPIQPIIQASQEIERSSLEDPSDEDTDMRYFPNATPGQSFTIEIPQGPIKSMEQVLKTPSSLISSIRDLELIYRGLEERGYQMERLYQGSRDGFNGMDYYSRMIGIQNYLVVAQSVTGEIFGGFNSYRLIPYEAKERFLFSLTKQTIHRQYDPKKRLDNEGYFIINFSDDLIIYGDCDRNAFSSSNLGNGYEASECSGNPKAWLAGSETFQLRELEGFNLTFTS
ncbi:hypothetical protein FGO68_gene3279 [Halteria grandinella]|uniref:TLDc domain-containing protein n=1 Tax=Halteria grandinella TaxID=5974 RepID=A0A8J8T023_HALGN|nr:hypothetical protein FGO68_gene3279 [Halteria grandinella]